LEPTDPGQDDEITTVEDRSDDCRRRPLGARGGGALFSPGDRRRRALEWDGLALSALSAFCEVGDRPRLPSGKIARELRREALATLGQVQKVLLDLRTAEAGRQSTQEVGLFPQRLGALHVSGPIFIRWPETFIRFLYAARLTSGGPS
jgi:hypothetical protein